MKVVKRIYYSYFLTYWDLVQPSRKIIDIFSRIVIKCIKIKLFKYFCSFSHLDDSRKKIRGKERLTILLSNNDLQKNLEFFDMPRASWATKQQYIESHKIAKNMHDIFYFHNFVKSSTTLISNFIRLEFT